MREKRNSPNVSDAIPKRAKNNFFQSTVACEFKMTQEEIASIESHLDVVLPQPYKEAALAGRFADPIHDDAKSIIPINSAFRAGDYGDEDWRRNLVAIGHDGGGNYFCLDTDSFDSGVYIRDHETLKVSKEYDSFDNFVAEWAYRQAGPKEHIKD